MENWEIAELPGACPTSYKVLASEAGTHFSFICCACLLFGALCMAWGAWKTKYRTRRSNLLIGASLLPLLSFFTVKSEWEELLVANDIRENIGTAPGQVIQVRKERKKRESYFYGTYTYTFNGQTIKGEAQLLDPNPGLLQESKLDEYAVYYIGRSYTVLFSKKHPNNSVIDLDCPQQSTEK